TCPRCPSSGLAEPKSGPGKELCTRTTRTSHRNLSALSEYNRRPPDLRRPTSLGTTLSSFSQGTGEMDAMNLMIWIPALFLLGLATLGLMFAFVAACERV